MVEVTRHNFNEILTEFEHAVQKSSFFSIDCEYSSLPTEFASGSSFFETGEDRYLKLKGFVGHCLIIQVGITPFRFYRDLNYFEANPYNFYIFPKTFGKFNPSMTCVSSTIQFLCDNKFNFNKVFYDGVSFLNRTGRRELIKEHNEGTLLQFVEKGLPYSDVEEINKICSGISKWLSTVSIGDATEVSCRPGNFSYNYVLREHICALSKNIWAKNDNSKITVKKIDQEQRLLIENSQERNNFETLLESLTGFSKIIDILSVSRKPLVGHNLFLDLLTIYHQFYESLPGSYQTYKANINDLFPHVYDTKFIAFELHRLKLKDNPQTSLANVFESYQNKGTLFFAPHIKLEPKGIYETDESQRPHDAGWDSYMTGFIFLKMADDIAQFQKKQKYLMNITPTDVMSIFSDWKNLICIARAKVSYVNLGGKDPQSLRPPLLFVSHTRSKYLDAAVLDAAFKKYEPLHKKPISRNSALIAVPNYTCFKKILIDFSSSTEFSVEEYSLLRHHRGLRACLIAGVLVPAILTVWFGLKPH